MDIHKGLPPSDRSAGPLRPEPQAKPAQPLQARTSASFSATQDAPRLPGTPVIAQPGAPRLDDPRRDSESKGQRPPDSQLGGSGSNLSFGSQGGFWHDADDEFDMPNSRLTAYTRSQTTAEEALAVPQRKAPPPKSKGLFGKAKATIGKLGASRKSDAAPDPYAEVGTLLHTLKIMDPVAAANIEKLRKALPGNPAEKEKEFGRILDEYLGSMSVEDLQAIHFAIKRLGGDADPYLLLVPARIAAILTNLNPALSPAVQDALREAFQAGAIIGRAEELAVRPYIVALHASTEIARRPHEVIVDAIAYLRMNGVLFEDMEKLFKLLPPRQLLELANANPIGSGQADRSEVVKLARKIYEHRKSVTERAFQHALDAIVQPAHNRQTGSLADPVAFALDVIAFGDLMGSLQLFDIDVRERFGAAAGAVRAMLDLLPQAGNLDALDDPQLEKLAQVVRRLGFEGPFGIEDARKQLMARNVISALGDVSGDRPLAKAVKNIRTALAQGRGVDFEAQLRQMLNTATPAARDRLTALVGSKDMREFSALVRAASRSELVKAQEELSVELRELEFVLAILRTELSPATHKRTSVKSGEAALQAHDALKAYGIGIDDKERVRVSSGDAPRTYQLAVNRDLAQLMETAGPRSPLTEAERQLCAGNEHLARALSRLKNPQAMSGVEALLKSTDTLVRLPDGSPVELLGERALTFGARSDGQGGLLVAVKLAGNAKQAVLVHSAAGEMVAVDCLEPAVFTYTVAISPEGSARTAEPLTYKYDLELWLETRFLKPGGVEDAVAIDADPRLVAGFLAFLKKERSEENFEFIVELNTFEAHPTAQGARALVEKFISQEALKQVNVSAIQRKAIEDAVAADGFADASPEELIGLFQPTRAEVIKLVSSDTFRRFTSSVKKEADDLAKFMSAEADAAAAQAERTAPALTRDQARVQSAIHMVMTALAIPLISDNDLARQSEWLIKAVPQAGSDSQYWVDFESHVRREFKRMEPADRASLLYNLAQPSRRPSNEQRHLDIVRSLALESLRGTREGRMTPEGVLVESPNAPLTVGMLADWFKQRRINEFELALGMARLSDHALRGLVEQHQVGPRIAVIAQSEIDARAEADQFMSAAREFMGAVRPVNAFRGEGAQAVVRLAQQLKAYQAQHTRLGEPLSGKHLMVRRSLVTLATWLNAARAESGVNWAELDAVALQPALTRLGISAHAIEDDRRLLELQQREQQEALPAAAFASAAAARVPESKVPEDEDIPPPPPEGE